MPAAIIVVMILVVVALGAYASWLLLRLRAQQVRNKRAEENSAGNQSLPEQSRHMLGNRQSIEVLARCLLQGQVSSTEAAIRITALARGLPEAEIDNVSYRAFEALANATAHIPILDAWRDLDGASKKAFESERAEIEKSHELQVMDAARALVTLQ